MKAIKILMPLLIFFVLVGCDASFGDKYTIGNLEIYFTPKNVGTHYVEDMGEYFQKNDLIQDQTHSIQLTSDQDGFIMRMVLNDAYKALPEEQTHNLALLEADIKKEVFNSLNFRIEVCNANFVPISNEK